MPEHSSFIDLMRHGEPVGGRRYRGHQDDRLSPKGWEQMQKTVDAQNSQWDLIVTSPLKRCREFSRKFGEQRHIDVVENESLREIGMGNWEGKTPDDIQRTQPETYRLFFQDPVNHRPENGEPLAVFFQRTIDAWNRILQRYSGKNILIIAHAGILRAIVCHLLHAPLSAMYRMRFQNAALIRIKITAGLPPMVNL